jgi:hypothetical protein
VETDAGVEIVFARLRGSNASLQLDADGAKVYSPQQIRYGDLELGFKQKDALLEIKKMVWGKLFPGSNPEVRKDWESQLPKILEKRGRRDENYYIPIPGGKRDSMQKNTELLQQLRADLPALGVFLLEAKAGDSILIVSESDLELLIGEYLRMLRKYE